MSIADEILRLQTAKSDLATSISNKGVTVPANATLDDYAALVDSIQTGGSGTLPYDAKIEYLESTGTQYIDSGVIDTWSNLIVTLDMLMVTESGEHDFFGSRDPATNQYNYAGCFSNLSYNFVLQIGTKYVRYGVNDSLRHTHIYNSISKTCTYDNTTTAASTLAWSGSGYDSFKLFQRIKANGNNTNPSSTRLYAATFEQDGVIIRDFIPVRLGQLGYLYDRVTGRLFGNNGTGAFILGNDVTT